MAGEPLDEVERGVYTLLSNLKKDPFALETAYLSLITFDAKARVVVPLSEVTSITPPTLTIRPGTSLGAALDLVRESIQKEVQKTTASSKGDYKPMVFILTDGQPTDDWTMAADRLRKVQPHLAKIYAIGCGDEVDFETLGKLSDACFHVKSLTTISELFLWLTASVQSMSISPDSPVNLEKTLSLAKGMELVDKERPPKFSSLNSRLFFHVTCQKTRKHYMMRYKYFSDERSYIAQDAVPLPDDFFSDGAMKSPPIDSSLLQGSVDCPYCHNQAWAKCGFCGHLFCLDDQNFQETLSCPVCETSLRMSYDESSFDIDGSQG
jgi:uncharacterized protein YegL